ncbi:MAG: outer membrane protein, partial [Gammaproteobacteria bacterium]
SSFAQSQSPYKLAAMSPAPTVCQSPRFCGFYVGGSLGAINNDFSFHDHVGHTMDQGEVSPTVGLFGGYRMLFRYRYSLGAEIFGVTTLGDASTNTSDVDGGGTHIRIGTRYDFGISLLPGMLLNEHTLGYLRIGADATRFNTLVRDPSLLAQSSQAKTKTGLELGFGLETSIWCKLNLRLEYLHTYYQTYYTSVNRYKIHPSSDRINLGLIYNFT